MATARDNAIARIEAAKAMLAAARSRADFAANDGERIVMQERITAAEALVRDAEQQLADLDRRASNAAVPREWRH